MGGGGPASAASRSSRVFCARRQRHLWRRAHLFRRLFLRNTGTMHRPGRGRRAQAGGGRSGDGCICAQGMVGQLQRPARRIQVLVMQPRRMGGRRSFFFVRNRRSGCAGLAHAGTYWLAGGLLTANHGGWYCWKQGRLALLPAACFVGFRVGSGGTSRQAGRQVQLGVGSLSHDCKNLPPSGCKRNACRAALAQRHTQPPSNHAPAHLGLSQCRHSRPFSPGKRASSTTHPPPTFQATAHFRAERAEARQRVQRTSASRRYSPPFSPKKRASGRRPRSSTTSSSEARRGWFTRGSRMSAGSTCAAA